MWLNPPHDPTACRTTFRSPEVLWFVQIQLCKPKLCCHVLFREKRLSPTTLPKKPYLFSFFLIILSWTLTFNMLTEACRVWDVAFMGFSKFLWALHVCPFHMFFSPSLLSPGKLLHSPHPADEDEPDLLLVPGFRLLSPLRPPGRAVPAQHRRPPVCDCDQRLCCGHEWDEQLLRGVSHQLEDKRLVWGNLQEARLHFNSFWGMHLLG